MNRFRSWNVKKIKTRACDRLHRHPSHASPRTPLGGHMGGRGHPYGLRRPTGAFFLGGQTFKKNLCPETLCRSRRYIFFLASIERVLKAALDSSAPGLSNELLLSLWVQARGCVRPHIWVKQAVATPLIKGAGSMGVKTFLSQNETFVHLCG